MDAAAAAALLKAIAAADAVSFDFFDTLFYRTVDAPEDVFDIMGRRFDVPNFRAQRKAAQAEAFVRMHKAGRKEISLAGIYECLPLDQALVQALQAAEHALELDIIRPDPVVLGALNYALELGKPVVITSDMYFTEPFFREALSRYGVPAVPLFISSTCDATKRDFGDLFDLVVDYLQVPRAKLLHVGDNPHGDVTQAKAKGLTAFLYRREAPATIPAATRADGGNVPEDPYELGYTFGGPCAVAFLDWMERQAREDGIDHLLFWPAMATSWNASSGKTLALGICRAAAISAVPARRIPWLPSTTIIFPRTCLTCCPGQTGCRLTRCWSV
ncbi:hypothetical protein UAJ10_01225 [Nitrospirillum sp. BR 11164]|uniref:hypothetical protein n=1 Tax=Nitrospirillum sp. BR 11164 TaxID=3104324 RepID=UPI002AFFD130|nr:hypothetical protein [Nitrospirillum sp. BR 11164]MEA1647638.1 hypothetical protein [Nitrospirillum sp. BR 11164]